MAKYKKKQVECVIDDEFIDAYQWIGDINQKEAPDWINEAIKNETLLFSSLSHLHPDYLKNSEFAAGINGGVIWITSLQGVNFAVRGDYIIRDAKGELYPCKPDIFVMAYEEVES